MQRDALAHPGQAVALAVAGGDRAPVVADGQLDLRIEVAQHHLHAPRRVRVLEHVGQRLLGDPVDAQLQLGRQLARRALDLELDRQARAREPADEARQIGALLAGPQHAEQPAHLGERIAAGLGDLRQRAARRVGILGRGVAAAVGLGDHHRQRVRDDVVQLARDPRALLRRPDLRLLVALDLERGQPGAAADPPVGEQRRHQHLGGDDGGPEDEAVEHAGERRSRRHHRAADERDAQPDRLQPARPVRDQVVEGDQRRQVGDQHVVGDRELDAARRHHGREDGDRRARPERQRRDERQRQDDLRGRRRDRRVGGEQPARDQLARTSSAVTAATR